MENFKRGKYREKQKNLLKMRKVLLTILFNLIWLKKLCASQNENEYSQIEIKHLGHRILSSDIM